MLTIKEAKENGWGDNAAEFVWWLEEVDRRVQHTLGLSIDDLPDWHFADAFEDGLGPRLAAEVFLEYIREDFGLPI